ncbi:MAG: efflux RND transporter periplasmic adaptor subunit [Bacteroidota bacterium]
MKTQLKILFLLLIVFIYSCKKDYTKEGVLERSNVKKVRVTELDHFNGIDPIVATGVLASKEEIILSFKTGGIVNSLKFNVGNTVKKGQQLASLNLSEINAQVESAENGYDKSIRDFERAKNLYEDTVATLEQLQNARTARDIAKANLEVANFNKEYSIIKSPVQGTILKRFVEEGQLVSSGQVVFLVGSSGTPDAQIIKVGIADKDVVKVNLKDEARIKFDAFSKVEYRGSVTEITQSANQKTGLYDLEITLEKYHPELKNGFIARIEIIPESGDVVYKIPMNALVEGLEKKATIFYTLDGSTVKSKEVEIIDLRDDYFTVSATLLPADAKIVNEGAPFLRSNDSIQIQP